MADLTSGATCAGGLGTATARWVFVFAWVCGIWLGLIDGYFSPLDPLNASAYAAGLAGILLLTTPGDAQLSRGRAVALVAATLYLMVVLLSREPEVTNLPALNFTTYLVAFAIPRGNAVAGGVGSALVVGYATIWGLLHGATGGELARLLSVPLGCVLAGIVWRLVLRGIVRRERYHRSAAGQAADRTEASLEAVRVSQQELADIRAEVAPLLGRIIEGAPIDPDARVALVRTEAAIRDRIRAPHLQHPELVAAFAELRDRQVTVVVLGEPADGSVVGGALVSRLVEVLSEVPEGRVTVRSLPPGRGAAMSIVVRGPRRSEQILLSKTGATVSRG